MICFAAMSFCFVFAAHQVRSQTPPGGAGPSPSSPPGGPSVGSPPAGITNGTPPIESTILAYKILVADAAKIAESLGTNTAGKIVVIGTSNDIAAIIQLRIVLSQAGILEQRLRNLTTELNKIALPNYAHAVIKGNPRLGAGFIASPAEVATLIQTLGSITAVNQTLSSAPGALNDATLISLIAKALTAGSVYIPSVYPPNLITATDINNTNIGTALRRLETARQEAINSSNTYLQEVQDAGIVATTVKGAANPIYSDAEIDAAGAFAEKAVTITLLTNAVTLASAAVDGFETSLFTGQGYSPAIPSQPDTPNTTASTPATPALPAPTPAPILPSTPAPTGPAPASSQNQGQQPVTASGTSFQQMISADLLLGQILSNPTSSKLELLSVHALESGGSQLSKSNLFLGSRIYFGGGAVASFALYDSSGAVICSGVGYGYKGNIREKNVEAVLGGSAPAVATVSTTCK
jgi:hypothetical protein